MKRNVLLWAIQGLLALLFLFAGGMKLMLPLEALKGPVALPGLFLRFLGVVEVLGAAGLILPGIVRIRQGLDAACGGGPDDHHDRRNCYHRDRNRRRAGAAPAGRRAALGDRGRGPRAAGALDCLYNSCREK